MATVNNNGLFLQVPIPRAQQEKVLLPVEDKTGEVKNMALSAGLEKRKADNFYEPEAKRAKVICKNNALFQFFPDLVGFYQGIQSPVKIEVPTKEGMSLQFYLPKQCFIKTFSKAGKGNEFVWVKKDPEDNIIGHYQPQAVAHVLYSALAEGKVSYQRLVERRDVDLVETLLEDVLDIAKVHGIDHLEQECAEFIVKRIYQNPSMFSHYRGIVCQSERIERAWIKMLMKARWSSGQKAAIHQRLLTLLQDGQLPGPQEDLISKAFAVLLVKDVVARLPSIYLKGLDRADPQSAFVSSLVIQVDIGVKTPADQGN